MRINGVLKVDKNKGIPDKKRGPGGASKYPFKDLKIGDSFLIPDKTKKNGIYSMLAAFNKKQSKPIKITIRMEEDGIRVWRIPNRK
jgi:hypothetical protein